jgi:hypothetical protein
VLVSAWTAKQGSRTRTEIVVSKPSLPAVATERRLVPLGPASTRHKLTAVAPFQLA